MSHRRRASLELLTKLLVRLAHIRIAHVHLPEEMIRQAAVIVETAQVCAAHVADLQLLVPGWARGILEILQVALADFFLVFGGADLVQLIQGEGDGRSLPQYRNFQKARVDCLSEVGNLFQLEGTTLA